MRHRLADRVWWVRTRIRKLADSCRIKSDVERLEADAVNSAAQPPAALRCAPQEDLPQAGRRAISGASSGSSWRSRSASTISTPWLRWDRGPFAPDQAVLVDLANRRFYFFFIEIWPQEFYFVAGLLVMAGIGLFLVTSTVGRAWCGYTCPQTVWVDLFLVVERADRRRPQRPHQARCGAVVASTSSRKRVIKHAIWLGIAVADRRRLDLLFRRRADTGRRFRRPAAAPVAYITVAILTATTYVFGGLMREQVCTYMCPWPRIQAAMLDENSLTVTYNDWRGEPRSRHAKKAAAAGASVGDCVDCNACVAVCPMGIDIRDGQQLECITCALCIDACDGVMDKLGKERGLISYATLNDYNANMALATAGGTCAVDPGLVREPDGPLLGQGGAFPPAEALPAAHLHLSRRLVRGRRIDLLFALATRDRLELNVLHDRNPAVRAAVGRLDPQRLYVKLLNMVPRAANASCSSSMRGFARSVHDAWRASDGHKRSETRRRRRTGPAEDNQGFRAG